jgi:phosphatidate phosphatase APP1
LKKLGINTSPGVKVYKGFGHENKLAISGHVLAISSFPTTHYSKSIFRNIFHLFKLFFVKPIAGVPVVLKWNDQHIHAITEKDGFFKMEWVSDTSVAAGLHSVRVDYLSPTGTIIASGEGRFFVPHITQLGIISDIDDTFLVSYSSTIFKRLWTLFTHNARSRRAFEGVREHYKLLEYAQTPDGNPNPIFYISSSEWNLYDYLNEFISIQKLPEGIFLLSQLKRWYELVKTGKTKHEGKFVRVVRVMEAFPKQQFILLGDNSQRDPEIYNSIVEHYPKRVFAVYIRNVAGHNDLSVSALQNSLAAANIPFCLFGHSKDAMEHSISIGLGEPQNRKADIPVIRETTSKEQRLR